MTVGLWAGPAARAEPADPTLVPMEPSAPVQAPVSAPRPAGNTGADEAAVRQAVQTSTDWYNAQNWGSFMSLICSARQGTFSLDVVKSNREERGPMQVTVTSVTIAGDSATAMTVMSDRVTVTTPYHLVREGDWKIC